MAIPSYYIILGRQYHFSYFASMCFWNLELCRKLIEPVSKSSHPKLESHMCLSICLAQHVLMGKSLCLFPRTSNAGIRPFPRGRGNEDPSRHPALTLPPEGDDLYTVINVRHAGQGCGACTVLRTVPPQTRKSACP